jgi:hypothetical protein
VILGSRVGLQDLLGRIRGQPGYQDVVSGLAQTIRNLHNFFRGLALAENDFRRALTKTAMVVHRGHADVFKGQVFQSGQSVRNIGLARFYRFQY